MKPITVYSKSYCPYCKAAKALLNSKGLPFKEIDVAKDPLALREMLSRSLGARTVPQIFIGEQHIGGFTELAALNQRKDIVELAAA